MPVKWCVSEASLLTATDWCSQCLQTGSPLHFSFNKIAHLRCTKKLGKATASAPEWNNSAPTGRIFMNLDILNIFRKSVEKIQVSLKSEEQGVLYLCAFMIISHSVLLRMRNVLYKFVDKIKTHVFCSITFFFKSIYEIMWKNIVERGRPQMTTWCMHIVCWLTKATDTHSDYVILIAFPGKNDYTNVPQCYGYAYTTCLTILLIH